MSTVHADAVGNPGASAGAIRHHYDVESPFWRLWLGASMTYSCAMWEKGDDLDAAQNRKLDFHIERARAHGAQRVLDIGCGWGAMLSRLVTHHDVAQAVGITLSPAQAEFIREAGLPNTEVRVEGWSEHQPDDPYDAIISLGAFEHFARPDHTREQKVEGYRAFFTRCREWLNPDGWLSLQTITYGNMRPEHQSAFMQQEIYPESELPYLDEIVQSTRGLFEVVAVRNDREDYIHTCRAWLSALRQAKQEALAMVGEETVRRYETYLRACIVGFHSGNANLIRMSLRRIAQGRG